MFDPRKKHLELNGKGLNTCGNNLSESLRLYAPVLEGFVYEKSRRLFTWTLCFEWSGAAGTDC